MAKSLEFRAVPPQPKVYTAIVDQILDAIRDDLFGPDGALPSERQLAESFATSRVSLREAIRVLEHSGVLEVRPGKGIYVAKGGLTKASSLRARAAADGEHSPLDLAVVRMQTEPLAAELAATHRTVKDLRALQANLKEVQNLLKNGAVNTSQNELRRTSRRFHLGVANATKNGVLIDVQHLFAGLMEERMWGTLHEHELDAVDPEESAKTLAEHTAIAEAIERGDPDGAREAMVAHLARLRSQLDAITKGYHGE